MSQDINDEAALRRARLEWFSQANREERRRYRNLLLSTHGLLLQFDIQRAFEAGAWASVIVLAQGAIEATIRDVATDDYETNARSLFCGDDELQRIREVRNELVHAPRPGTPSLVWSVSSGDFAACHASLEPYAKLAVRRMFRAIYSNADT